nr:methyltransferase domain-containing protein [uncultured Desulfobacter sp.]
MNDTLISKMNEARHKASTGNFQEMTALCRQILEAHGNDLNICLDVGTLFQNFGFLSSARECYERILHENSEDSRVLNNLANLARDKADHDKAMEICSSLVSQYPHLPIIRRNFLISQEYDPNIPDLDRFQAAREWGDWIVSKVGGPFARPTIIPLKNRPLRIGYVSFDFCQHTVGLFLKPVIETHNPERVNVFAYNAGKVDDWVTHSVRTHCTFRDITSMDDLKAANLIREDRIDVLVDLSGHTAGSRLALFAHRPAPVQVSWLGYFATTGLSCMDAVLLDRWHAPSGAQDCFIEKIIHLPSGRICYQPVPFAPEVAPLPSLKNGYVTFGSFNNTAKLNTAVFDLWAKILSRIPQSRLVLKWRTFNDPDFRQSVRNHFIRRGIEDHRIELRGPSFHADVLAEYADIDIGLDPFPFSGCLTSCEALWMGVPVITLPKDRVVSRQTHALLSAIGLKNLSGRDDKDYIRIAVELAEDSEQLNMLRTTLRQRMQASSLCNVKSFAHTLENSMISLYNDIEQHENRTKIVLNVGAGHPKSGASIPKAFKRPGWKEVRLDIDPANEPDIRGSMLDMSAVEDESVHAVFSSHVIEHLYPNEVELALKEMLRVLKPEGYAVITCPDLQAAAQMIFEDRLLEIAYQSPAGPVTPFDIVYSHRQFTGRDKPFMAHHCGFTLKVLVGTLQANGFKATAGLRRPDAFDLWVVAAKAPMDDEDIKNIGREFLPV